MRRLGALAALVIGTALFVSGLAFAAPVNIAAPLDTRGPVATAEQYPDRDYVLLQPKVFQTRFTYGADGVTGVWGGNGRAVTMDSTIAVPTKGCRQVALLFQFSFEDSTSMALFAFQIRGHSNSGVDTMSTYALPNFNRASSTSSPDTIGSLLDWRMSNRFGGTEVVKIGGATADTTLLFPGERPMVVAWSKGPVGQNIIVPINTTDGVPFVAPYMSFRLRLMNTFIVTAAAGASAIGSAGAAYGSNFIDRTGGGPWTNVICELCVGDASVNKYGRYVTVTADLVGLR